MKKSTVKKRRSLFIEKASSDRLAQLARRRGISFNAALNVVLGEALRTSIPSMAVREGQTEANNHG